jgi:hypothetical protein
VLKVCDSDLVLPSFSFWHYRMIMMMMGRNYASKLWPPICLLLILQMIYAYGELWWNNISKGKLLICPLELSSIPTSSHLVVTQEELGKENDVFDLTKYLCSYLEVISFMP